MIVVERPERHGISRRFDDLTMLGTMPLALRGRLSLGAVTG